jgi:NAD(P)-dependent dehydrogenase (short-subunit alcohol dehydrogenase family)
METLHTALVTGANRGIGLALTQEYRRRGDRVIAVCRSDSKELRDTGAQVESGIDVTDDAAFAALVKKLNREPIHHLWLNAGILEREKLGGIDKSGFDSLRRQFEVNALGPLRVVQGLLENLSEGSKVGIMTSRMGSMGDNDSGGYYGYRASKAAVNAIGKSLAVDLKSRGVSVFLVHPGYVATDMVGRSGDITPEVAAQRMVALLDKLGLQESGSFRHSNGSELPW